MSGAADADSIAPLWTPDPQRVAGSNLTAFMQAAGQAGAAIPDGDDAHARYAALHAWSCQEPEAFWRLLWSRQQLRGTLGARGRTEPADAMPGTRFFPDGRLNFAENLLAPGAPDDVALIATGEGVRTRQITRADLRSRVRRFAGWLLARGVTPGDRVAAVVPNTEHAVIGALGAAAIGAVWSSCSPDFGVPGILDRFTQIEPTILIGVDGYRYNGKLFDIRDKLAQVRAALSPKHAVLIDYLGTGELEGWVPWRACTLDPLDEFPQLPFDQPLYVLFSSGTTGQPKCIVHGAGGTLLQHVKEHALHSDIRPGDRVCYFTTCGWMMWNWLISGLAVGATVVLYEGSPAHPGPDRLIALADELDLTFLGVSAGLVAAMRQAALRPSEDYGLGALRTIASTGSPLSDDSFRYVYAHIKRDVQLASISGGTDIVSCFVLGNPNLPVYAGQIQCRGLGMAVDVFDESGDPAPICQKGELVCTAPFPSMPVTFWGAGGDERYRAAYFERFDNVWHHGDYAEATPQGGIVIHGRSDATLNPGGVRIGTAEIYRVLERMPEVADAAAIGAQVDGDVQVILFVVLPDGADGLGADLEKAIRSNIRAQASPRHVPKRVYAIGAIPKTRTGKIAELALKTWVEGGTVANRNALVDADVFDQPPPELA